MIMGAVQRQPSFWQVGTIGQEVVLWSPGVYVLVFSFSYDVVLLKRISLLTLAIHHLVAIV